MATLEELEAKLGKLAEKIEKPRDNWDRAAIIGAIAVPIALGVFTWRTTVVLDEQKSLQAKQSNATEELKAAITRNLGEKSLEVENVKVRAGQAQLATSLAEHLLSDKPERRKLATAIILFACGESGKKIVDAVASGDSDKSVREFAQEKISQRRQSLINQLVDPDHAKRWNAAEELGTVWHDDGDVVSALLQFVDGHKDAQFATYNTVVVLADLGERALASHRSEVEAFLNKVETSSKPGPALTDSIAQVRAKLARGKAMASGQ